MPTDTAKFTELLKPHYNDALKYSRALCSSWSPDDAEDVLQQSFLLALENFGSLKDISKFRSWFFKIITTTFYSSIRRHFWKKFLPLDDARQITEDLPDVFDRALQTESRMILNRALSKLSKKERSAVLLFEIADFSIEEITAIQNEKSLSAVKSRLSRARIKLRKYITEQEKFLTREDNTYGDFNGDLEMKHSVSSQKSGQNVNIKTKTIMEHKKTEQNENISLERHLNQVKQEDYSGTFPKVENWLYKTNIQLSNQKQLNERKLHKMKNFFFAHKLRLVYTIVALLLVIGACNMPVTQTETAGKMITMVVPADNNPGFQKKMNALPWMKNAQVTSNENTNNGVKQTLYKIVLPNTTEEQVKGYCRELEALGDITTIRITSMDYDVKRPLYSAALNNFFSIDIDATGLSDEELKNELERKMKEQGVDMKFKLRTTSDGRRDIMVERDGDINANKEPQQFEMNIEDDNGKEKIKLMTKKADPHQFDGKTDDQIREMVRKDFNNPELKDSDIIIDRTGKEVQVKIQMDKKEVK